MLYEVITLLSENDVIFKKVERLPGSRLAVTVYDENAGAQVDAIMGKNFPNLETMTVDDQSGYIQKNYRLSDREVSSLKDYAVITSYSIHYTKLYDLGLFPHNTCMLRGFRELA